MEKQKKIHRIIGLLVFTVGLLLGLTFNGLAVWGDLEGMSFWGIQEAAMYNAEQEINARLGALRCPILISSQETGTIQTTVSNPHDKPTTVTYQADISNLNEEDKIRSDQHEIELLAGEKRVLTWTISPEDRVYDRVVQARSYLYKNLPSGPARTKHCGILVFDFPGLQSQQIIGLMITSSLLCMAVGGWMSFRGHRIVKRRGNHLAFSLIWFFGIVLAGMLTNLLGMFFLSALLLVIMVISLISLFELLYMA